MLIDNDPKLDFDDVLIRPKRSELGSRKEVELARSYQFLHSRQHYTGIPILAANMDNVGTLEMAEALHKQMLGTALHKHLTMRELLDYFEGNATVRVVLKPVVTGTHTVFFSMGILPDDIDKLKNFSAVNDPAYICIDVANGYSERFAKTVAEIREICPKSTIMAGNVVTAEMTEQLILSGADIVKVGIGPGSVCTTRKMTGVGYPQLSAIIECADAAHGLGGLVCADGGCKVPGDVAKAFAAGADFVMLGGMFAGHDESNGELVYDDIPNTPAIGMKYYGMSSSTAMEKHSGGVADYRASEGKEVIVPYRGKVENTVKEILGGLRSACTYTGARRLKDLSKCTTFVKVNRQLNTVYGD